MTPTEISVFFYQARLLIFGFVFSFLVQVTGKARVVEQQIVFGSVVLIRLKKELFRQNNVVFGLHFRRLIGNSINWIESNIKKE